MGWFSRFRKKDAATPAQEQPPTAQPTSADEDLSQVDARLRPSSWPPTA
ncbi:hypothetical protein [Tessaracoccus defluvii]|uniref:Uncharacterized protein n=1 Tax=Tessaracoccus defluvii TaxID=1285901 RepID=A0A7H0H9Z6_9ACTN|nr:hypothetical protein [Tessaracoccus defluvii]QNP57362.1 hypothetical protein H9L22_09095 [Tessaracoccus defluvii]